MSLGGFGGARLVKRLIAFACRVGLSETHRDVGRAGEAARKEVDVRRDADQGDPARQIARYVGAAVERVVASVGAVPVLHLPARPESILEIHLHLHGRHPFRGRDENDRGERLPLIEPSTGSLRDRRIEGGADESHERAGPFGASSRPRFILALVKEQLRQKNRRFGPTLYERSVFLALLFVFFMCVTSPWSPANGLRNQIEFEEVRAGKRHHRRARIAIRTDAVKQVSEGQPPVVDQDTEDTHPQIERHGPPLVGPDHLDVAASGFGLQVLDRQRQRLKTEIAKGDLDESLVFQVALLARRHDVEMESTCVVREHDRVQLYLYGRLAPAGLAIEHALSLETWWTEKAVSARF